MSNTVYARLYDRLSDLIPGLATAPEGGTFYAPPHLSGDMAIFCQVSAIEGRIRTIELADDHVIDGQPMPAPWITLRVDTVGQVAEVIALQDSFRYEVVYAGGNVVNPRKAQINLFAVNWLQVMLNLQVAFQAAELATV